METFTHDSAPQRKGLFASLSPKGAFWFGMLAMLGVAFGIGFFVLLGLQIIDRGGSANSLGVSSGFGALPAAPSPSGGLPNQGEIKLQPVTEKDWIRGKKSAKITIVEFSDTECPFCKRFHPTMQRLVQEYPNDVRWVYKHFPLDSLHRKARKESEATECAGELGGNEAFWKYLDRLFEITPSNDGLDLAQLPQIAQDVGLNRSKFEACLNSGRHAQKVQDHYNQGVAAGAQGTPYSVVVVPDGQNIPISGAFPYEEVKSIIDSLLRI